MSEAYDHLADAEVLLSAFRHSTHDDLYESARRDVESLYLQAAQVHATLALCERLYTHTEITIGDEREDGAS